MGGSGIGGRREEGRWRTRRQALLKLLGLVGVLQDEGVEVLRASDLELGLRGSGVLLDPGGCTAMKERGEEKGFMSENESILLGVGEGGKANARCPFPLISADHGSLSTYSSRPCAGRSR